MTNFQTQNFSGYVLAGGKSSRMGTEKALLEIGGEKFLARAARTLSEICAQRVKIVVNREQQAKFEENLEFPLEFLRDIFPERGAVGGIYTALKDCPTEFAVVLAVDLPFVTSEALENLARIAAQETSAAVVPRQSDGRWQPLSAIYRAADCLPVAENLITREKAPSAREFLARIPFRAVEQIELSPDERIFFNVNRPADFEALREN